MEENNRRIAQHWLKAFNNHDLETLLSLYHDDAEHFSPKLKMRRPETNGFIRGKQALRDWWHEAFERLPQLEYVPVTITSDAHRVFMEYKRHVPGEETMNVAEVLDIEDGQITHSRVYHG